MKRSCLIICLLACFPWLGFSQLNVTFRSQMAFPGIECANIWGYVDTLGNEYALVGTEDGVRIIDVTNPVAPVQKFLVTGNTSFWREIKTWGKYAFVTTEATSPNPGIQIINLSNLPASVSSKYWRGTGAINNLLNKAHALHIDAGYLYLYGSNLYGGAPLIVNLMPDPWNPVYMGYCTSGAVNAYVHDGYVRNDTLYAAHIYGGYFAVWNVTNKSAPVLVSYQNTPGLFTHNAWLTDSSRILLTTDEVSNSFLASYDITDPYAIVELDRIQSQNPASGSIVHNTHVKNDFAVSSWYRDGITIVDASRRSNLVTTGWYDCNTALSGNGFNSVWGVYPFLPSGNIVVSDIEQGLFVLTPNYVRACYLEGTVTDSVTGLPINTATVQILSTSVSDLTKITGQYKTGTATAGTYSIQFSKAGYVTKTISGVSLTNGNLTVLNTELVPLVSFTVTGVVRSAVTTNPVASANVKFENSTYTYNTTTNASGSYTITGVYSGTYDITVGKWLYQNKCVNMNVTSASSPISFLLDTGIYDDFTFNYSWTVTGNAATGAWVRGTPVGTTYVTPGDANPGVDAATDCSKLCFVTGNGGGTYGYDDVDNGSTTLTSPLFNLTGYSDPYINYHRWFFNIPSGNAANDTLRISLSNGVTTAVLENVIASTPPGMSQWVRKTFRVSSFLAPTASMRLIIYTADQSATPNTLEAGFDFFNVTNSSSPLPVELGSFNGVAHKNFNRLLWTTFSEVNNSGFDIEKSVDGIHFIKIGFIKGAGTSTSQHDYEFDDFDLTAGVLFYRLKQIDFNGMFSYSEAIKIKRTANLSDSFLIYPNPANDFITVESAEKEDALTKIKMTDTRGQVVYTKELQQEQNTRIDISDFAEGIYFLEVQTKSFVRAFKVVKQ